LFVHHLPALLVDIVKDDLYDRHLNAEA
jgi:hypothetical protein